MRLARDKPHVSELHARSDTWFDLFCVFSPTQLSLAPCRSSGCGQTGSYSRYVSYGGLLGAQSGLFSVGGYSNAKPLERGITYDDPNAGALGAFAAIAALIHRARTEQGQYIDVAL
jgi:crotonobetainyl-CoA:carnitine CoA-transferase CaiB-like acyl-CoA transferase